MDVRVTGLVQICREVFGGVLRDRPHQIDRLHDDVQVTAADLLDVAATPGDITRDGLLDNVEVALLYLESWLRGNGAVGIHNLMEDAATAEISRSQIWQWVHNRSTLDDGTVVTDELVRQVLEEEMRKLRDRAGEGSDHGRLEQARDIFAEVALSDDFVEFLTFPAYDLVAAS